MVEPLETDLIRAEYNGKVDRIKQVVADVTFVPIGAIMGRSRHAAVARARLILVDMLHRHTGMTMTRIGTLMARDHTTIVYSIQRSSELLASNEDYQRLHKDAEDMLK